MKTTTRLAFVLAPLALSSALLAQPAEGSGFGRHHRGPGGPGGRGNPIMRVLDADKNHEISATELANASTALRTLDTNADGTVSAAEFHPARPADAPERPAPPADAPARTRPVMPVMLALDANSDGDLSASEITNAPTSLAALDANKDGKLTLDEVRPLPPEGASNDGAQHGPHGSRGPRGPRG